MAGKEPEDWKEKYLSTLDRLEAEEKRAQRLDADMRVVVVRLCLLAQGFDDGLDERIGRVRKAARENLAPQALGAMVEGLYEEVREADKTRIRSAISAQQLREALDALVAQIRFPMGFASQVQQLRQRLTDLSVPLTSVGCAEEVATFLGQGLAWASKNPADHRDGDTALPGAAEHGGAIMAALAAVTPDVHALAALRARIEKAPDAATAQPLIQQYAAVVAGGRAEREDLVRSAAEAVRQLLGLVAGPADLQPRIQGLQLRLGRGIAADAWPGIVAETTEMVRLVGAHQESERQGFEQFLLQLTEKLREIDDHLKGTEGQRQSVAHGSLELEAAMRARVQGIESSMKTATTLDQLRGAVQQHIEDIRLHLEVHRHAEDERQTALQARLARLTGRMQAMEGEAQQLREHLRQRSAQAMSDPLTGVASRLAYEERVAAEHARSRRYGTPLALLVVDVDHFKAVNDRFGHKAGDKALTLIAKLLRQALRGTDLLARYGGEEFVVLLPEAPAETAAAVSDKLRRAVAAADFQHNGAPTPMSVSVGYAVFHEGETAEQVFQRADAALYRAKAAGRNCCVSAETAAA